MELTNNLKTLMMFYQKIPANQVQNQNLSMVNLSDDELKFIKSIKASDGFSSYLLNKFKTARGV